MLVRPLMISLSSFLVFECWLKNKTEKALLSCVEFKRKQIWPFLPCFTRQTLNQTTHIYKKFYKLRVQQFLLKLFTQNFAPLCILVPIVTQVIQHHNFNQEWIKPLIQFQDTGWHTNLTKTRRDLQNTPPSLQWLIKFLLNQLINPPPMRRSRTALQDEG